jgi:hypothetical protein
MTNDEALMTKETLNPNEEKSYLDKAAEKLPQLPSLQRVQKRVVRRLHKGE